jgi:methylated-DNA-[protein]-cysteine S-methyltransferase
MTPLCWTRIASPVGELLAAATPAGLLSLSYAQPHADAVGALAESVGQRPEQDDAAFDELRAQLVEYFAGSRRAFDLPLDWSLAPTGFSAKALKVTASIPFGETMSYAEVAAEAGSPRAARAVGNAMRRNAIAIVIPCHRVLHADGGLGGYMGGEDRGLSIKRHLLAIEGVPQGQ